MNQIQAALDFDARPRRVELVDARLIRDSGRRRATLGKDNPAPYEVKRAYDERDKRQERIAKARKAQKRKTRQ